jgi:glucokinase
MAGLLSLMPVHLILDPRAALMGAADLGMEKK